MLCSAIKRLFLNENAADTPQLVLGRAAAKNVVVNAPCVIKSTGGAGSGRTVFLYNIARQAIKHHWGLVYIDIKLDTSVWANIYTLAERAGRASSCFAQGGINLAEVDIGKIIEEAAILYSGLPFLKVTHEEATRQLQAIIEEVALSLERRAGRVGERRHVVVILDGIVNAFHGMPSVLESLLDKTAPANVSFVFSDSGMEWSTSYLDASSAARVYHCYGGRCPYNADFNHWSDGPISALQELETGHVLVASGTPSQKSHFIEQAVVPYAPFAIAPYLRPANALKEHNDE